MKNIHVLPTDKLSRLHKIGNELGLTDKPNNNFLAKQQNIYITSDEEIKEGDWYYYFGHIVKYDSDENTLTPNCKKIILTTDQDLIKDGVQAIDDEFLEWFVKNPSCEEVEVNHFGMCCSNQLIAQCINCNQYNPVYKIIIPKEPKQEWTPTQGEQVWIKVFSNWSSGTYIGYDTTKHIHLVRENEEGGGNLLSSSKILPYKSMPNEPKQETLEEAVERLFPFTKDDSKNRIITIKRLFWIEGIKWQQERMYSEEEVFNLCREFAIFVQRNGPSYKKQQEWFEQFKKK
jgi:hypothetical protein